MYCILCKCATWRRPYVEVETCRSAFYIWSNAVSGNKFSYTCLFHGRDTTLNMYFCIVSSYHRRSIRQHSHSSAYVYFVRLLIWSFWTVFRDSLQLWNNLQVPGFLFAYRQREISPEIFKVTFENKQCQSGRYGEEKNLCPCREFDSECTDVRPVTYSVILSDMTVLAKIWTTFACFVCAVETSCRACSLFNTDTNQYQPHECANRWNIETI